METHDQDPISDPDDTVDPWQVVSGELGELSGRIADTYRRVATDNGPSEEDIKQALATLADAWDQVAESVTAALQDPDVRERLKSAASSLASAVGETISGLGSELRAGRPASDEEE